MNTSIPQAAVERKAVKKLTIEIVDEDAVLKAYPGVKLVITKDTVDRKKLRPLVNAMYELGEQVPGVKAYYASEQESGGAADANE